MRSLLGVNLPYLYGSYGHDLAPSPLHADWPCDFDLLRAYLPLLEAKELGLDAVRIWLCEGAEGIVVDRHGKVDGVHPRLLQSVKEIEEGARTAGVKVYWTLLDANSAARDGDALTAAILSDEDQAARFAEKVAGPVARALDPSVAVGLEIVNEPEVVTPSCADVRDARFPSIPWATVGRTIRLARRAALADRPELLVTAGTGHVFLPELWRSGAELSAVDVHLYAPSGGLPPREHLADYVGDPAIAGGAVPVLAGECGIPKDPGPSEPRALANYLNNADRCGYAAAFLWKLEGDLVDTSLPKRPFTEDAQEVRHRLRVRPAGGFP